MWLALLHSLLVSLDLKMAFDLCLPSVVHSNCFPMASDVDIAVAADLSLHLSDVMAAVDSMVAMSQS